MSRKNVLLLISLLGLFYICFPFKQNVLSQDAQIKPLRGHRVLLLGNSHTEKAFGLSMMAELTAHGVTYFASASQPDWGVAEWWNFRENIERLIVKHRPTLLLMQFGGKSDCKNSNRLDYESYIAKLWKYTNKQMLLVNIVKKPKWRNLWISPVTVLPINSLRPKKSMQFKYDLVAEQLKKVVSEENYLESRDITGEIGRMPDGIHFTNKGAQIWARKLRSRIEKRL